MYKKILFFKKKKAVIEKDIFNNEQMIQIANSLPAIVDLLSTGYQKK